LPRLVALSDTGVTCLTGERFLNEYSLESLLEANPELIALDEVDAFAGPLTPIGRQVPLSGQALDLLFIDSSCKLTAVEAKLERNAEVRRQVVAQILEYGAYLSEWDLQTLEAQAERYFSDKGTPEKYQGADLYQVISQSEGGELQSEGPTTGTIREQIRTNLERANMRLIVAVDGVVEPLRKLVAFINGASSFELLLLEVQQYTAQDGLRIASINLFGGSQRRKGSSVAARGVWNEERFFEVLRSDAAPGAEAVVRELLSFIRQEADALVWGTGAVEGTAGFAIRGESAKFTLFWVTTKGSIWLNGSVIHQRAPLDLRRALLECLMYLGVPLNERVLDDGRWPSLDAVKLQDEERIENFKKVFLEMKHTIAPTSSPVADAAATPPGEPSI
jgi:hypothetical protein